MAIAAICLILTAVLTGLLALMLREEGGVSATPSSTDGLHLGINVNNVDASANAAEVSWWVEPRGRFDRDGVMASDVALSVPALAENDVTLATGTAAGVRSATVDLTGDVALYPFDSYAATIAAFAATKTGDDVPVEVVVRRSDSGFGLGGHATADATKTSVVISLQRTASVRGMAILMFCIMWALAIAVAAAAMVIIRRQQGLVWPAMGWMAATLFALVAFRNAAPGAPPVGCLLDLMAFFWSETVVVASLVSVVVAGIRVELSADAA
jgi:hypothetical protein